MKAYKILREIDGKLFSYEANLKKFGLELEYKEGKVIKPKIGRLFCFKNRLRAIDFYESMNRSSKSLALYEISATQVEEIFLALPLWIGYNLYDNSLVNIFWKDRQSKYLDLRTVCTGSHICKSMRLIKRILPPTVNNTTKQTHEQRVIRAS